jgi:hypothetical protein
MRSSSSIFPNRNWENKDNYKASLETLGIFDETAWTKSGLFL